MFLNAYVRRRWTARLLLAACVALAGLSPGLCKQGGRPGGAGGGRQSGARGEALGGGGVALTGDILSSFYNPAGIYGGTGLSFATSFADGPELPGYGDYRVLGAGVPVKDWGAAGVTWYGFKYDYLEDRPGPGGDLRSDDAAVYTLTFAGEPVRDLYLGANLNLLRIASSGEAERAVWPDVGLIKVLRLPGNSRVRHRVVLGSSLANLTYSSVSIGGESEDLPVTLRIGGSYSVSYAHGTWMSGRLARLLLHFEYRNLLNLSYGSGPRLGGEVSLLDMLSARVGYYLEDTGDYADQAGTDRIEKTTFGLGLALPIYRFTGGKIPLRATIDWADIEVQPYLIEAESPDSYSSWTIAADLYL